VNTHVQNAAVKTVEAAEPGSPPILSFHVATHLRVWSAMRRLTSPRLSAEKKFSDRFQVAAISPTFRAILISRRTGARANVVLSCRVDIPAGASAGTAGRKIRITRKSSQWITRNVLFLAAAPTPHATMRANSPVTQVKHVCPVTGRARYAATTPGAPTNAQSRVRRVLHHAAGSVNTEANRAACRVLFHVT